MIEILYGLASGMLMQRGEDDTCDILIGMKAPGDVVASTGSLTEIGLNDGVREFRLTGIPVGGPYTLTLISGFDRLTLRDLYVGDLWMLAGQSNMVGFSRYNEDSRHTLRDDSLRGLYMCDKWFAANPLLHQDWRSEEHMFAAIDCGEIVPPKKIYPGGVGPGYYLLKEMKRFSGVPQGAIPCAAGGTGMDNWVPYRKFDNRDSLYGNMLYRFRLAGSHVRGLFWYQGCTDAMNKADERFTRLVTELFQAIREDFHNPELPIVQYQLFSYQASEDPRVWQAFSSVREQQRKMTELFEHFDTVATLGSETDDSIHLTGDSHKRLAPLAAESMAHLCYDPEGKHTTPAPALDSIHSSFHVGEHNDRIIEVKFKNLHGDLRSVGQPTGFALSKSPDCVDTHLAFKCYLRGDTVVVRHLASEEELPNLYLWYAYGCDLHANITDTEDRPIPAFGPIPLKDTLS